MVWKSARVNQLAVPVTISQFGLMRDFDEALKLNLIFLLI